MQSSSIVSNMKKVGYLKPADLNLNKDYLNTEEAAIYCGVSRSQFTRRITGACIPSVLWMGRKLYKRADLARAIDSKLLII